MVMGHVAESSNSQLVLEIAALISQLSQSSGNRAKTSWLEIIIRNQALLRLGSYCGFEVLMLT